MLSKLKNNNPHIVPLLLLLILTFATFSEVLTHSFLTNWDDPGYVTGNPAVRGFSWANITLAFSSFFVGNYAPVQIVSYMLDYTLWGLNPTGFLLANVGYHALSVLLLYYLLVRHGVWRWGAFFGSAIFLLHPVQIESVAWISQRKNLLAMLFYLLAFHAYLRYQANEGPAARKWYLVSLAAFLLSLLSKTVAIIFPLMLVMYDYLVLQVRRPLAVQRDKIPFLAAAFAAGVIGIIAQFPEYGGGRVDHPPNAFLVIPMTMLPVLVGYLRLLFWPDPAVLSLIYDPPMKNSVDAEVVAAVGVFICLLCLGWYLCRRDKKYLFWYALFFLGLLPVSQIVQLLTIMNDRYLYFPMLGVAGLAAYMSSELWERLTSSFLKRIAVFSAVMILLILSGAAKSRGRVWKNSITLFSDTVPKVPGIHDPWFMLAQAYEAVGDSRTAAACYERSALPGQLDAADFYFLGRVYLDRCEYDKASAYARWLIKNKATRDIGLQLMQESTVDLNSCTDTNQP